MGNFGAQTDIERGALMIDTKQLKHAAKAAGFKVARIADDGKALMLHGAQEPWNPRTDNGQAFELGKAM